MTQDTSAVEGHVCSAGLGRQWAAVSAKNAEPGRAARPRMQTGMVGRGGVHRCTLPRQRPSRPCHIRARTGGQLWSFTVTYGEPEPWPIWAGADHTPTRNDLLSSGSQVRVLPGALNRFKGSRPGERAFPRPELLIFTRLVGRSV